MRACHPFLVMDTRVYKACKGSTSMHSWMHLVSSDSAELLISVVSVTGACMLSLPWRPYKMAWAPLDEASWL